mgnify:CR=1 FL=1
MKHYNTGLTKNAVRRFNMKCETMEPEVMDQIVPVVHLREDNDLVISGNALNGNVSVSISSYGSKGDLYLRGVLLSYAKDAAEDSTLLTFQFSSEEGTMAQRFADEMRHVGMQDVWISRIGSVVGHIGPGR